MQADTGFVLDVPDPQGGEFAAAERAGEPQQDQGAVAAFPQPGGPGARARAAGGQDRGRCRRAAAARPGGWGGPGCRV